MPAHSHSFEHHSSTSRRHTSTTAGGGELRERIITLPNVSRFHIGAIFTAKLTVDPERTDDITLRFKTDEAVLPHLRAKCYRGVAHLELESGAYAGVSALRVEATVGRLTEVVASGGAHVVLEGISGPKMSLTSSGGSRIVARGRADVFRLVAADTGRIVLSLPSPVAVARIAVDAAQAGVVELSGRAHELDVRASGAARVLAGAPDFAVGSAHVHLSGVSEARVRARDEVRGQATFPARLLVNCPGRVEVAGQYRAG